MEATGELLCIPPDERKLVGLTLLARFRDPSTASVDPAGLLPERTALLDDEPPRTNEDACMRSGSAKLPRAYKNHILVRMLSQTAVLLRKGSEF